MRVLRGVLLLSLVLGMMTGCATTDDLKRTKAVVDTDLKAMDAKVSSLQTEMTELRKELDKANEALSNLRKAQADTRADLTELRESSTRLQGASEGLQKDATTLVSREKELREKLDRAAFRITFLENFLGISKKDAEADAAHAKGGGKAEAKGKSDKESLYAAAYERFKEGKYEKARGEFLHYLKTYPESDYAANAQFWVGECYYFEKKYEKAILEYEKVVKSYPEHAKVPYAMVKQGLSFLKLGDKASARVLLQNVVKDYPNTSQARIARGKLVEMK